jgi:hypothetical protein
LKERNIKINLEKEVDNDENLKKGSPEANN